ncbi:Protein of unknown function [Pyronema omphalodes CBS 100304]|uniref:Uncharacterized protein n=1 Tax=Pyronema omphalodes (strain CBS 100304) TaxID=1076935 RepID=U4LE52_PYROM|nr:Protein of unknown function [Pyronema omphalodes CBS 100304]
MATLGDQTMELKSAPEATVNHEQDMQNLKALKYLAETIVIANDQSKNVQDCLQQEIDQLTKEKDLLAKENGRLVLGYHQLEEKYNQLKDELANANSQPNTPETQKLIDNLTLENGQLKEAREFAIEQLKDQPIMQDMINKLVDEKTKLEEELSKLKEHSPNSTAEMEKQIQQLQEENNQLNEKLAAVCTLPKNRTDMEIRQLAEKKEVLANELKMLRKENTGLQKELDKAGQDGPTKDMAKLLKRYYEMEEQFAQMKKEIKQDVKNVLAKKEKKIVQLVQGHLVENEKRLVETEDHFKQQVEGRLTENDRNIQQRLEVNEAKICEHGQQIQQKVKESIAEHDQKIKESQTKHNQHIKESIAELSGETVNEQGYFTRMIPMKKIAEKHDSNHRCNGGGCLYVEHNQIVTYDDFKMLIKSVWGIDLNPYEGSYKIDGESSNYDTFHWPSYHRKFKRITITPHSSSVGQHLINCDN